MLNAIRCMSSNLSAVYTRLSLPVTLVINHFSINIDSDAMHVTKNVNRRLQKAKATIRMPWWCRITHLAQWTLPLVLISNRTICLLITIIHSNPCTACLTIPTSDYSSSNSISRPMATATTRPLVSSNSFICTIHPRRRVVLGDNRSPFLVLLLRPWHTDPRILAATACSNRSNGGRSGAHLSRWVIFYCLCTTLPSTIVCMNNTATICFASRRRNKKIKNVLNEQMWTAFWIVRYWSIKYNHINHDFTFEFD